MNKTLFRIGARIYIAGRARSSAPLMKQQTLNTLKKFNDQIQNLTAEQLSVRSSSAGWSPGQIVFHAFLSTRAILRTCESLRKKESLPDMDPKAIGKTKEVSREELLKFSSEILQLANDFDYSTAKTKSVCHPLLGRLDYSGWLTLNVIHLERHFKQLQRSLQNQ